MFSSLLDRPLIKAEVSPYYSSLLAAFSAELDVVKVLYDTQIALARAGGGALPAHTNMPPVAGQLQWSLELQQRLEGPHRELFAINHPCVRLGTAPWALCGAGQGAAPVPLLQPAAAAGALRCPHSALSSAEAELVSRKFEEMIALLQGYREETYGQWMSGVDEGCRFNLEQPLILRDPSSSLISVNFSRKVGAGAQPLPAESSQSSAVCRGNASISSPECTPNFRVCWETFWVFLTSAVSTVVSCSSPPSCGR